MEMNLSLTEQLSFLTDTGELRPIDLAFANFIARQKGVNDVSVLLAAAVSKTLGDKHSYLDLSQLPYWLIPLIDTNNLNQQLIASSAVTASGEFKPLVLQQNRLYLHKYWLYEHRLAAMLMARASAKISVDQKQIVAVLDELFPVDVELNEIVDWQKVAVATALTKRLAVISGGPGTGKTTTVTKLMAAMLMVSSSAGSVTQSLNIKIAAPTGKAASRLAESIKKSKQQLSLSRRIEDTIPSEAQTIHRLLGVNPSGGYRHNAENPMHADVVVIDEASMVDLSLMYALVSALPSDCMLILLGDKDQLASVETGTLLGDLCQGVIRNQDKYQLGWSQQQCEFIGRLVNVDLMSEHIQIANLSQATMQDSVCMLRHSFRFSADSGIGHLAKTINYGSLLNLSLFQQYSDIELIDSSKQGRAQLVDLAAKHYKNYLQLSRQTKDYIAVINQFLSFTVLCASHEGEVGVKQLNQLIEQRLQSLGLINHRDYFYSGRPIMISENDYALELFNGDIGLLLPDLENEQQLRAYFIDSKGQLKSLLPARLPKHETVYAMTIHKSQGSEFDYVAAALPRQQAFAQHISRELIYTAVTRAKKQFHLLADGVVLKQAVGRHIQRCSGLFEQFTQL